VQVVRRQSLAVAVFCCTAVFSAGCRGESEAGTQADLIPDFRLSSLDGREIGPSDYEGKVLLLEFWATWCTPCHAQARILESLYASMASDELEFLAISVGESPDVVRRYTEKSPFTYPVLVDPEDELSSRLMIYALPTIVIVDRGGHVVYSETGISPPGPIRKVLDEALREVPEDQG
jgi:peroxiredoxin